MSKHTLARLLLLLLTVGGGQIVLAETGGAVAETNLVEGAAQEIWGSVVNWLDTPLFTINASAVTALGLLRALFIFLIAITVSRFFRRLLKRLSQQRESVNEAAVYSVGRVSHYVILVFGLFIAASSLGINFSNLAIMAGALGVGVGMGLQNVVNNFVSGLILLFERSLKVGDFVELSSGVMGTVREISIRSTLITTNDNVDIVIPNSEFVSSQVTNWTMNDVNCRLHIPFGAAYGTDKELVKKAVLEAADRVNLHITDIPQRQPKVWLVNFGDSSLDFELLIWLTSKSVRQPEMVRASYLWEIENSLNQYDIEIPFPQRDLRIRNWPAESQEHRPV